MISESEVERNGTPRPRSSEWSSTALIRLPLWARASVAVVVADDRLRVLPLRGAGGRVADVADRHVADQRAELVLVEDLGDQALVADRHDAPAAGRGGDPGRLLPAVLEGEQGEVGEARDVMARRIYAEHAALVARPVAMIVRRRHGADTSCRSARPDSSKASSGSQEPLPSPRSRASRSSDTATSNCPPIEAGRRPPRPITARDPGQHLASARTR